MKTLIGIFSWVACLSLAGCESSSGLECGFGHHCAAGEACFSLTSCADAGWCPFYCADPSASPTAIFSPTSMPPTDGGSQTCYGQEAPLCCAPGETLCVQGTCSAGQWCMIDCCP